MTNKLPWVRNFYQEWIMDFAGTDAAEKATYSTLTAFMYRAEEPIYDDTSVLARAVGCSVQAFKKSLEKLIRKKLILQLENGNLWSAQVEEELKNCNENLSRLSEKAIKAANTRRNKQKDNSSREHDEVTTNSSRSHDENMMTSSRQHINNNNNSYNKKTKTIVLAKKEINSENLETNDLVEEPIEDDALKSQSEQIEAGVENQPPIHEQESVPKKAKQAKAHRGCRIPADFEPNYDFALAEGLPPERIKIEIAKFRDYWRSKAGANATKTDWQATWRNWIRNSKKYEINQQGKNYGNYTQKQKSIGERIADSLLDIENRGYFEAHSRDDTTTGVPIGFEGWQPINKTAGSDCFRGC
ncbi:DUF1376 domain-containing protein [Bartonella raoultii]|uniref:YdaU family protein n=1 Tax=Bartonella raoultii TaxID=1457020 RepID=A0ABS7IA42_9HYPH|nr:DUF1376 domain-containing protein [Bartonella raoultii]MBX4336444.1 YdaU family protein [Bartonella raoultii]